MLSTRDLGEVTSATSLTIGKNWALGGARVHLEGRRDHEERWSGR